MKTRKRFQNKIEAFQTICTNGSLEQYRALKNNYLKDGQKALNINEVVAQSEDNVLLSLCCLQRSAEFFLLRKNILNFASYSNNERTSFILPPNALAQLSLSRVEKTISSLRFFIGVLIISMPRVLRAFLHYWFASRNPPTDTANKYVFVHGLTKNCLAQGPAVSHKFVLQETLRNSSLLRQHTIASSLSRAGNSEKPNPKYLASFLPKLSMSDLVVLYFSGMLSLVFAFLALLAGRWREFYALDEKLLARAFKRNNSDHHIDCHIFLFQGTHHRPFWSWLAERQGVTSILYMYATLLSPTASGKFIDRTSIETSTWSNVIGFSDRYVRAMAHYWPKETKFISCGTAFFSDDVSKIMRVQNEASLVIFDIPPLNWSTVNIYDNEDMIFSVGKNRFEYSKRFIDDCLDVANQHDLKVFLKPKRHRNNICKKYAEYINELSQANRLCILDANMSPYRALEYATVSIVEPFTSVGASDEHVNKICYYDPFCLMPQKHECALGTKLCIGKVDLSEWVKTALNNGQKLAD